MKKYFIALLAFLFLLHFLSPAYAEQFAIVAEGEYVMGDGETPAVAEERALKKARQNAAEQAGAYVKSYSRTRNLVLEEDVVEVVANHTMKITVLERRRAFVGDQQEAIKIQVKIRAEMSREEVEANLKKTRDDRMLVDAYNKMKADFERQTREMEALKGKLAASSGDEKKQLLGRIADEERKFRANLWLERAQEFGLTHEKKIQALTKAIEWNPDLAAAYLQRARAYRESFLNVTVDCTEGQEKCRQNYLNLHAAALSALAKAMPDINRAIEINPNDAELYLERISIREGIRDNLVSMHSHEMGGKGKSSEELSREMEELNELKEVFHEDILDDFNLAIGLQPDNPEFYRKRAWHYDRQNYHEEAIADLTRAIVLRPGDPGLYYERSQFYEGAGDSEKALEDMTRAIDLCKKQESCSPAPYYSGRARIHHRAGENDLAEKDYRAAREEGSKEEKKKEKRQQDREHQESENFQRMERAFYESEFGRLFVALLDRSLPRDEIRQRMPIREGSAEDCILKARSTGMDSPAEALKQYAEAVRLLKERKDSAKDRLLLAMTYMERVLLHLDRKKVEEALQDLHESQALIDGHLARALKSVDAFKAFNALMDMERDPIKVMKELSAISREQAEDFYWLKIFMFGAGLKANLYEELNLPDRARIEYERLCRELKDERACRNFERLKPLSSLGTLLTY